MRATILLASVLVATASSVPALKWGNTKYMMVFGDSYTATGYNISAGIDSPTQPGKTYSNGPTWAQYLEKAFNVTSTKVYNLAYGGAIVTRRIAAPYTPEIVNLDEQIQLFLKFLSPPPASVPWKSNDTLFAVWIGINDIFVTYKWTNVTQTEVHSTIMDAYFQQLSLLYTAGARSFLLLTIPPIERSPYVYALGSPTIANISTSLKDYNKQLNQRAKKFQSQNLGSSVAVYDTSKVFNTLLNNADELGYVNVTGFAEPYSLGTPSPTMQIAGYPPVSSYFWIDFLHPLYTVQYILAHAISTFLSV